MPGYASKLVPAHRAQYWDSIGIAGPNHRGTSGLHRRMRRQISAGADQEYGRAQGGVERLPGLRGRVLPEDSLCTEGEYDCVL